MRNGTEFLGYVLAAAMVVGAVAFFAFPAEAESYRESTVEGKDWTSEPPYHWSITAPTEITDHQPTYETTTGTVWKRDGRRMVKMTEVEIERRNNVEAQTLIKHEESHWPDPSVH